MTTSKTRPEFDHETTDQGLDYNAPQKTGRRLWGPMFIMAIMAFPVGLVLSWVRASEIASSDGDPETIAQSAGSAHAPPSGRASREPAGTDPSRLPRRRCRLR